MSLAYVLSVLIFIVPGGLVLWISAFFEPHPYRKRSEFEKIVRLVSLSVTPVLMAVCACYFKFGKPFSVNEAAAQFSLVHNIAFFVVVLLLSSLVCAVLYHPLKRAWYRLANAVLRRNDTKSDAQSCWNAFFGGDDCAFVKVILDGRESSGFLKQYSAMGFGKQLILEDNHEWDDYLRNSQKIRTFIDCDSNLIIEEYDTKS